MPSKKHRFRKILFRTLLVFAALMTCLVVYFLIIAIDRPPEIKDRSSLKIERKKVGKNTYLYGKSWLRKSESGIWEAYIEGQPFERGVAFGQLTKELLYYQ
jgi:isopenicillin-N N-acyltransferase like protein